PRIWFWVGEPAQLRITALVKTAEAESIKMFDLFDGLDVPALRDMLLARFNALDPADKQSAIAEHPRAEFVEDAIAIFGEATSFRNAESLGQAVVLPLCEVFVAEHIAKILDAVEANGQIYMASGMPEILEALFDRTTKLLPATGNRWRGF